MNEAYAEWAPKELILRLEKSRAHIDHLTKIGTHDHLLPERKKEAEILYQLISDPQLEKFWASCAKRKSKVTDIGIYTDLSGKIIRGMKGPTEAEMHPPAKRDKNLRKIIDLCDQLNQMIEENDDLVGGAIQDWLWELFLPIQGINQSELLKKPYLLQNGLQRISLELQMRVGLSGYVKNISKKDGNYRIVFFIRIVQSAMYKHFGTPLDEQVAALTNSMFGKDIDRDYVRARRKEFDFPDDKEDKLISSF